ncbi:sensor domain-containing diguanylate cyclase [Polynucleobacter rarus]|uniref:sensor domain-containing diguanylate cyclase n=1 Tax=Polynucleobacter rarus TaxID=556055 RepID=UPI00131F34CC|nr:sensor domain-containing diguanylate cyclase [Polynucleobacter rarus]
MENLQTIAENNSIKLAIANKKVDQSEKRLLSTLEEFKSAEVKLDVAQNELLKREELLRYVSDISGNGIWDWNILTGEVKPNNRWMEMLGEDPRKQYFSVNDFKNRIHPDDLTEVMKQLSQTLDGLKDYQYRYRMIRSDGTQIWVEDKGRVVEKSDEGKPMRMVGAITDISEEVSSNEKLQALAFYDPLTKVLNRRLFEDRLDQTLKNAERHQQFGALLILDLDKFKDLNDTYGHQVGDLSLVEVAKRMKVIVPEVDAIARIGGDEFAILLSKLGSEYSLAYSEANNIAEKLCQSLSASLKFEMASEKLSRSEGSKQYSCSTSIGVTLFLGGQLTQSELLAQADFAMYQAKKAGGNQVCFYSNPIS